MDPERDIVVKLKQSNKSAVRLIFNLYHKSLYYFAKETIHNHEVAEDIVADAFTKLWERNTSFNELVEIKSFLFATVRDSCLNYLLAGKVQSHKTITQLSQENEDYIESKMIKAELLQIVLQEIESLPPLRRKIFKMAFRDGLSIFQIAEKLQLTVDTIRVQKAKAMHTICSFKPKGKI